MTDPLYEERRRHNTNAPARLTAEHIRKHIGLYIGGNREARPAVARLVARELPLKLREQGLARQRDLIYILRERFKRYSADGY